ncbi:MAG: signal peptidase I [Spirochaetia bacterium]|nr:signal peptidase I [Spirochaetia bacterium]
MSDRLPIFGRIIFRLCVTLIIGSLLAYITRTFLLFPHRFTDSSMAPNIKKGELIFLSPFVRESNLGYEKMVFANLPESISLSFAGRIFGKPGDKLSIINKKVYRNDQVIITKFANFSDNRVFDASFSFRDNLSEIKLEKDEYFIICDNRDQCMDSREYGPISLSNIIAIKLGK